MAEAEPRRFQASHWMESVELLHGSTEAETGDTAEPGSVDDDKVAEAVDAAEECNRKSD